MEPKELQGDVNPVSSCSTFACPTPGNTKSNKRCRDEGVIRHKSHSLDLGKFPSWHFPVAVAGGRIRQVNIPSPDDRYVTGLPLGLDVPKVIADNYEGLLRMVSGLKHVVTDTVRESARYQHDAARFWDEVNYYSQEYSRLLCMVGGGISKLEHQLSSGPMTMPTNPTLLAQENDRPLDFGKGSHGKGGDIGSLSSCPEVETTSIASLEPGEIIDGEPMEEVTSKTSSCNCPTPDSAALAISSTAVDVMEGFEFADNLKIPVEYEILYKRIYEKYGHMATKQVIRFNYDILLACVTSLLKVVSAMETVRGVELSEALLEKWDGSIKDAEALKFNIEWLRQRFKRLENHWKSSVRIDRAVECHEQVLDAIQVNYDDLWTRKDRLDAELSGVKIQMKKAEETISSQREAIHENLAQKFTFRDEPVIGNFLS